MPYTVDDAIQAAAKAQARLPADKVAYIQASVSITDAGSRRSNLITGSGPLFRTTCLGNLWWVWDLPFKFLMQRQRIGSGTGAGAKFLLGLEIEPLLNLVRADLPQTSFERPPRFSPAFREHYLGTFGLYLQPLFSVVLTEDPANPKLTGTITSSALARGAINPPATIEVVLEKVAIADVQIQ